MADRRLNNLLKKVKAQGEAMRALSDAQLQAETPKLKAQLKNGKTL